MVVVLPDASPAAGLPLPPGVDVPPDLLAAVVSHVAADAVVRVGGRVDGVRADSIVRAPSM